MTVLHTSRLRLRPLGSDDAEFVILLLNDSDFIRNIGDRGVRTVEDAIAYIQNGPGGLDGEFPWRVWLITTRATGEQIGTCGLLKRATMTDVEVGYALMPEFRSKGYAIEAVSAVAQHARETLGIQRMAAIVNPENTGSIRVLEKLGMRREGLLRLDDTSPEVMLFRSEW